MTTQTHFTYERSKARPLVRVAGDVDFSTRADFEAVLERASDANALTISFLECTFCDSSIIGALMKLRAAHPALDVVLLVAPGTPVARVFELVGIERVFTIAANEAGVSSPA